MTDTGLLCLVYMARHFDIAADPGQLTRAYVVDVGRLDTVSLMRAAKDMKLKVRLLKNLSADRLGKIPFPAVAPVADGRYVVVLRVLEDQVVLFDPAVGNEPIVVKKEMFLQNWHEELILFAKRYELPEELKRFGLGWFIPVIGKYKRFFLQVLGLSLLLQLFGLTAPFFTQVIIDKVLVHRSVRALDVLLCGMILVAVFENFMLALRSYIFTHTTNKIDVGLSSQMFKSIMSLPLSYFEKWKVGDVVSRVGELENIRSFITGSSLTVVLDIIFSLVYLTVMFIYSPALSCISLVVIPAFLLLNILVSPLYRRWMNEQFLVGAANRSFLIESVTGIRALKSMAVEKLFVERYEEILAKYIKSAFLVKNLSNIAGSIGSFIQQMFSLAILWLGAYLVIDGSMSIGKLIAFRMLAGQVVAPILRLVNMWQYFQKVKVSIDRVGDIMNEKTEPAYNPNRTTLPSIRGQIVFDKVSFCYEEGGRQVLQDVSLTLPAGIRVGIVGQSGSGKSTLTKLIQRLYVPERGKVLIDGIDLAQVEPAWLRRQIGVVLQENFLFGGSVKENIAIANPNAGEEEIIAAARLAGADGFIRDLPRGYDTFVGERGSLLSGGQRQRIAIARALLLDPRILIFDEATSALDYESERIIMDNLHEITKGRTTVLIAHRLSTVRDCDAIVVMHKGRIVEIGTHEKLLEHGGYYAALYAQQN